MYIVTGGAGFIGSNIVATLNARGCDDILVVDDLADGAKSLNLVGNYIQDYLDKEEFLLRCNDSYCFGPVKAVLHMGACSSTTERNGNLLMSNNYSYSKKLLHWCLASKIPLLYASSAAVYGTSKEFREHPQNERPRNPYGYSKMLFDHYVRRLLPKADSQIVGCRYFNVYGPREQHKGSMASVVLHIHQQIQSGENVRLFESYDGYGNGEHRRDFIYVADAVDASLWLLDQPKISGIFNIGTGHAQSFNEVARSVIAYHGQGHIEYIPFPQELCNRYQSFTKADISALRNSGYARPFRLVHDGVRDYLTWLSESGYALTHACRTE